ncbi:hemerythrin domain-containing protein [Sandaracinus amylolyticus]|uniref:Proteophosphoglycan 5 n=1 Tax=Sandaracinus amylolyticus TaxID=927083 RepID=A0A0F6W9T0_9BACT|nr:hemerythrin domain-containing protein [Sandaracinus amylolyticus]AKF11062.1 Proteophosphoglycan 5 [Sandaracinus amylolyticus]
MTSTLRALIEDEHRELDALLARADAAGLLDLEAFEALRARLLRHIAIEEKLILAEVRVVRGGEPIEGARRVRVEHGAIASLLVGTPDVALVAELRSLLIAHEAFEEQGLYAACEVVLGPERALDIAHRARTYPAIPVAKHFDGPLVPRTAADALRGAARMKFAAGGH